MLACFYLEGILRCPSRARLPDRQTKCVLRAPAKQRHPEKMVSREFNLHCFRKYISNHHGGKNCRLLLDFLIILWFVNLISVRRNVSTSQYLGLPKASSSACKLLGLGFSLQPLRDRDKHVDLFCPLLSVQAMCAYFSTAACINISVALAYSELSVLLCTFWLNISMGGVQLWDREGPGRETSDYKTRPPKFSIKLRRKLFSATIKCHTCL